MELKQFLTQFKPSETVRSSLMMEVTMEEMMALMEQKTLLGMTLTKMEPGMTSSGTQMHGKLGVHMMAQITTSQEKISMNHGQEVMIQTGFGQVAAVTWKKYSTSNNGTTIKDTQHDLDHGLVLLVSYWVCSSCPMLRSISSSEESKHSSLFNTI